MSTTSVGRDSRVVRQREKRKTTFGNSWTKLLSSKSIVDKEVKSFSGGEYHDWSQKFPTASLGRSHGLGAARWPNSDLNTLRHQMGQMVSKWAQIWCPAIFWAIRDNGRAII